jgi:hypothetical protein
MFGSVIILCALSIKVSNSFWRSPSASLTCSAVERAINNSSIADKGSAYKGYLEAAVGRSNYEARVIAKDIVGEDVFWEWDRKLFSIPRAVSTLLTSDAVQFLAQGRAITILQQESR